MLGYNIQYEEQYTPNGNFNIFNNRYRLYEYYTVYTTEKPKVNPQNIRHMTSTGYVTKTFTSYTGVTHVYDAKYEVSSLQKNTESVQYNVVSGYVGDFRIVATCTGASIPTVPVQVTIGMATSDAKNIAEIDDKYIEWGEYLANAYNESKTNTKAVDSIVLDGKDIDIKASQIEQYETFYEIYGYDNPESEALNFAKEYSALYAEAVKNGFTVTDEEVKEWVNMAADDLQNKTIESCFDSENDYFDFRMDVDRKDCIIMKYVKNIENQFADECDYERGTQEFDNAYEEYFSNLKKELINKQSFVSM